jgi:gentisate 1,2-dioxygenase
MAQDLAEAFHVDAERANLLAYWEAGYRKPHPDTGAVPHVWKWEDMKGMLRATTELIKIDKAERRGMFLANPGLTSNYSTPTLWADIQMLSPGEKAPPHRHTTSSSRLFIEGSGGYTVVEGEKCMMGPGDLVLNPSWAWHDHGNEGDDEITYLNVLDIPLVETLGAIFYEHADFSDRPEGQQSVNASERLFARGGLMPRILPSHNAAGNGQNPQLVYKWDYAREWLEGMKDRDGDPHDGIILEYINPRTGGPAHATMAFYLQLLRGGETTQPHRHTSSSLHWVVEGEGYVEAEGERLDWKRNDVFALPSWARHSLANAATDADAVLMSVTDAPAVKAFGLYRSEAG